MKFSLGNLGIDFWDLMCATNRVKNEEATLDYLSNLIHWSSIGSERILTSYL